MLFELIYRKMHFSIHINITKKPPKTLLNGGFFVLTFKNMKKIKNDAP
jgi:hypothetical protein